jgi:hypothetical protein
MLGQDGKSVQLFSSSTHLDETIILMGCDPAFEILGHHISRLSPLARITADSPPAIARSAAWPKAWACGRNPPS